MKESKNYKKRVLKHFSAIGMAILTSSLMVSSSFALDNVETATNIAASEGSKEATKKALDSALKLARTKPAMSTATGIVCLACIPLGGAAVSPGLCVACGILIAKTFG